jgi:hypothetical protein
MTSKNALHGPKHQARVSKPRIRLVLIFGLRPIKVNTLMKTRKGI